MTKVPTNNSNTDGSPIVDVNKPGVSSPDASGRPVVVTHKPMVQDPMMAKPASPTQATGAPAAQPLAGKGKTVAPTQTAVSAAQKSTTQPQPPNTEENTIETGNSEQPTPNGTPKTGETPIDKDLQKKKEQVEAEVAEKEANEKKKQLIADKTYFAPIKQANSPSGLIIKTIAIAFAVGGVVVAIMLLV